MPRWVLPRGGRDAREASSRLVACQPVPAPVVADRCCRHPTCLPFRQVCISSRGVLKVTHMLTLAGSAAVAPEPQPLMGTFTSQVRWAGMWVGLVGGLALHVPPNMDAGR